MNFFFWLELVAARFYCDSPFFVWKLKKITMYNDEGDSIYEGSTIRDFQSGYTGDLRH